MGAILIALVVIVVLIVLGVAALGLALKLLWWALLGLVIGALARLVVPGRQAMGILMTILVGVGGALLGGIIADAIGVGSVIQFVIAVAVAALLVAVVGGGRRRRVFA